MSEVVVRLMGGLGNQMFQYATGHAAAKRLGVPLLLDRTFLDSRPPGMDWTPRDFALDVFAAPIAFADPGKVAILRRPIDQPLHRRLRRLLPSLYPSVVLERHPGFDAAVLRCRAPVYLEGFWQNEGHFLVVADELRFALFVPREAPDARNRALAEAMQACVSASVHVRQGDYAANAATARYHGVCPPDYFHGAARELAERHGVERFFVFSDDPDWAQSNLSLPRPSEHIAHNTGRAAHWDLWLMKQCRHHIIANSSFSWWGAWLDPRPDKAVIAPARWFAGTGTPASAIIPPAWTAR